MKDKRGVERGKRTSCNGCDEFVGQLCCDYCDCVAVIHVKPGIHDTSFASKSPFKFLEFKFFDRVYHTRNLNQKT
jgi:hypothetical protein